MSEEELISAYVDERLSPAERAAFDTRMAQDPALRRRVAATRLLVREARALPVMRPPRNFILPLDAGRKPATPERRGFSFSLWIFRLGSLAAVVAFVSLVALEVSRPASFTAAPAVLPAPAAEAMPQPESSEALPDEPAAKMMPMLSATEAMVPQQDEALPTERRSAADALEAEAAPAGAAQSAEPMVGAQAATDAAPTSQAPLAPSPITPGRVLAALALLAAIILGVLGWVRR